MKKENKNKDCKFNFGLALVCGVCAGALIGTILGNKDNFWKGENYSNFVKYKNYFQQTDSGKPLRIRTSENPIPFLIKECDEQTRSYIIDGIKAVDDISNKINYVIYDESTFQKEQPLKYIELDFVDHLSGSAVGETQINYNKHSGEIYFPIKITVENHYKDGYWDYEETESLLTTIVTHELCHTLGLTHYNDSIMETDLNDKFKTLADDSITPNIIKYCYDNEYDVTVTYPVDCQVRYINKEKNDNNEKNKEDEFSL